MRDGPHLLVRACGATALAVACAVLSGPASAAVAQFGVAVINADSTGCLAVEKLRLGAGDSLLVAGLDSLALIPARVVAARPGGCVEGQGVLGDSVFSYTIRLRPAGPVEAGMGVAVVAPGASGAIDSGRVEIRVPGSERAYTFRHCASMEGIHFTAWQGARCVWHAYYYVPFDLEADCTEEEAREWPDD